MYSTQQYSAQQYQASKLINQAQLDTIIEAILAGKYSYACMMTLEATGHDPLDYIPYRTYNRLQKQRQARGRTSQNTDSKISPIKREISDLDYIEPVDKESKVLNGGHGYCRVSSYKSASQRDISQRNTSCSLNNIIFWPTR